ncbi:ABC-2 type transporter [Metarhizium album ARSEF 1941]|uniref:ABC-2 type transporter n=1 Tax=Metarhizium album (strain ARSEF 1941) TaxID=1081103 RepID=A0A0B2X2W0_METAS|nr:ABC-2 type transporter [Metarhizium album ARSEF 1941]KHO00654.1 ABC-2 type transporter [Metarhizium album ARSEF 1941]
MGSVDKSQSSQAASKTEDPEQQFAADGHLDNSTVKNITWSGVTVTVKDRETKVAKRIVDDAAGAVQAGEICALMGPSGCGKTTLLNVLARRPTNASDVQAEVLINGSQVPQSAFRQLTCFVEQEDALTGSLTVRETLDFASRLASTLPRQQRLARIDSLLSSLGLAAQASTIVGTPIRKGISGGQKRRVGVASQLITSPRILFLDEPTSGLDSAASWEVVNYLRAVARRHALIVVCSIHQPSTATFNLFDKLMLLSAGKTHFFGPVAAVVPHLRGLGVHVPSYTNPAEFLLELVNLDFSRHDDDNAAAAAASARLDALHAKWLESPQSRETSALVADLSSTAHPPLNLSETQRPSMPSLILTLLHRSLVKSYRDVVAYGIRIAMYTGLAVMMGTVWVRLPPSQESIQPLINALFFGSAFMSFMAVAYVPAFLEDRLQYAKDRHNGLYGPLEFILSNFLVGLPYLFLISVLFSAISYWLSNFRPSATAFLTWVMWLFLDLVAAESLVVFMSSLVPSFVVSLALVAFANGLWMSVGGFMVPPTILNAFYKYVFHYWDYQKYVFEGMMVNEFGARVYACGPSCRCAYASPLAHRCEIAGQAVLDQYGYAAGNTGRNVAIIISIIAGYRIAAWLVLKLRN